METSSAQILSKNTWELQQLVKSGKATARTRQMLLRAYGQHVAYMEDSLGVEAKDQAYVLERDDSRDGLLVVHGTKGTPADLRLLGEAAHAAGHSVYGIRLPGRGEKTPRPTHWESDLLEVQNRYEQLADCCKNVTVLGFGFGATLVMQLDVKPLPKALVLLAPALFPRLSGFQRTLMRVGLDRFDFVRKRMGWRAEVLEAMSAARRTKWWYTVPVYAALSKDDASVDASSLGFLRSRLSHHRTVIREFASGGHELQRGPHAAQIEQEIVEFLRSISTN